MSRMAESFFAASPLLLLPVISMLVFGAIFVAITVRALRAPVSEIDRDRALPLEEDLDV